MSDLKNKIIDSSKIIDNDNDNDNDNDDDNGTLKTYNSISINDYDIKPHSKNIKIKNTDNIDTLTKIIKKKSKNKRCNHVDCKKKLTLIDLHIGCKCNNHYCAKHMNPHNHMCVYDNKKDVKELIGRGNPLCNPSKLVKI
jgi:hypothetical protein